MAKKSTVKKLDTASDLDPKVVMRLARVIWATKFRAANPNIKGKDLNDAWKAAKPKPLKEARQMLRKMNARGLEVNLKKIKKRNV